MTKPDYLEILFVLKELGKWAKKMRKDYSFLNLLKNGSYGSILCLLLLQIFVNHGFQAVKTYLLVVK